MTAAALPAGALRWPLAFTLALGAHLAVAGFIALKPHSPAVADAPPPPPAILLDLTPPVPLPPPPPPPLPRPVTPVSAPKPPPVIDRAVAKLPPPPKDPPQVQPMMEAPVPTPAPSAPPSAPQPAVDAPPHPLPSGPPPDAMAAFQGRLMAHLGKHKRYPMASRQRRQQGTAWVRLTLDRQGRVVSHHLERGCGVEALDREATELVIRAQPLPAIPAEMGLEQMELVLPVEFSLR
ncbi:hypothetical protein CHU95_07210 [Niveispirillum lacus]|uniref:TonB C-terminal domain-containing protein n=1 Tax=Niveispirillum lacus TaxID=1981099 RepID=A0A255Z235_9PROT|nr:TonB family protein [Niveispirillum lacus]OYQ35512.1 hypothetical protein CHU95_07210 [Niveispirillum lacus]